MDVREKLIGICFREFCNIAGDSPCGCDGCPYGKYGSDVCYEEYKKDKLENLEKTSVTVQECISQTELPWTGEEIAKLCIRYMEEYADFHGYASSKKVKEHIVRLLEIEKDGRIAILPQPPKGE